MSQLPSFRDRTLLQRALTHRSYANEHQSIGEHNERLEFLGDAILNFLSGEFLYRRYPTKPEGELTPLRSALVDERQLAQFARSLNLGSLMQLGKGAEQEGGRQNPNLLSSTFEAVVGAYFLDTADIQAVRAFVEPLFEEVVDTLIGAIAEVNFKSRFQEWALATFGENPKYLIVSQSGPDHAREFVAEVWVKHQKFGEGKGRRKQDAEKRAAADALARIKEEEEKEE
ncbi:ribonuclease III [Oscillatoria sp. FACHB-1407]|uniref:ribonuclease III n=1 Tax=Oscillatoria sp. FACHB-1407 TaxID=2692847 RepID=UPI001686283D|nr:ribonuclease III [Oscillatoria sp. FACHB-1407]MBD2462571.1 ribonuclease III [Oscillatoria sp. FACHB-1407]